MKNLLTEQDPVSILKERFILASKNQLSLSEWKKTVDELRLQCVLDDRDLLNAANDLILCYFSKSKPSQIVLRKKRKKFRSVRAAVVRKNNKNQENEVEE